MDMDNGPDHPDYDEVSRRIAGAGRILLATHKHPDGDAVGCLLGMSNILALMGASHTAYCPEGIPKKHRFLAGADRSVTDISTETFDLTLLFDTSEAALLPAGFPGPERRGVLVVIDHHGDADDMGDVVIRRQASSTGEILFEMARHQRWPVDSAVAECLYTSIVSDTSSFKYESATPAAHRAAAELIGLGASPWRVASHLFESYPLTRQRLLTRVLETLAVSLDGRLASLTCTREMLGQVGATREDLDGVVNFARAIDGVALAVLVREEADGQVKVSLRSKGEVDASRVARALGGGGHVNAGGCYLSGTTVDEALSRVREAARKVLLEHPGA